MPKKLLAGIVVAGFALALPATAAKRVVHKSDLPVAMQDSVSWYSTGVGADTRDVIVRGFPLKLIFATKKGELAAGVEVTLVKGGKPVFSAKNVGPWLFVDVPAGTYDLRAKADGQEVVRKAIRVPAKGIAILTVHLPAK
ncbi:MAG: hypothetical protein ACE5JS_02685 [Nitrospinota bacterium]